VTIASGAIIEAASFNRVSVEDNVANHNALFVELRP